MAGSEVIARRERVSPGRTFVRPWSSMNQFDQSQAKTLLGNSYANIFAHEWREGRIKPQTLAEQFTASSTASVLFNETNKPIGLALAEIMPPQSILDNINYGLETTMPADMAPTVPTLKGLDLTRESAVLFRELFIAPEYRVGTRPLGQLIYGISGELAATARENLPVYFFTKKWVPGKEGQRLLSIARFGNAFMADITPQKLADLPPSEQRMVFQTDIKTMQFVSWAQIKYVTEVSIMLARLFKEIRSIF